MRPRCGEHCLAVDPSTAEPLSASARPEAAWIVGDRVVRAIAHGDHPQRHPFALGGEGTTIARRATLLGRLRDAPPPHVLPVLRICRCSFESPWVDGRPLQDFGLGRDANRLVHPQGLRIDWPRGSLEPVLHDLTRGLLALHAMGIAHGDPASMNAMLVASGGLWVDLNSVRPATAETIAVDTAAFTLACLWPALLEAEAYSPSLFAELTAAERAAKDPLQALGEALGRDRDDHVAGDPRAARLAALREAEGEPSNGTLPRVSRTIAAAMASAYFLDQSRSDQTARFYRAVLDAERVRNQLAEEERTRLHYRRFHDQVEELRAWSAELEKARDYHHSRADASEAQAAQTVAVAASQATAEAAAQVAAAKALHAAAEAASLAALEAMSQVEARLREQATAHAAALDDLRGRHRQEAAELGSSLRGVQALLAGERSRCAVLGAESEALREQLVAIHGSRLWRTAVRYWRLRRAPARLAAGLGRILDGGLRRIARTVASLLRVSPQGVGWRPARALFRRLPLSASTKDLWMRRLLGVGYAGPLEPVRRVRMTQSAWPESRPLVSVVIPSFNYGDYLAAAVDSVLAQTWRDLEVLVVEGGSTREDCREAARALQRPKTTVLWRETRAPVGDNRNHGAARARGKYICCLDADDELRATFLEKAVFLAEAGGFDVVSTSIESYGRESRIYHVRRRPTLSDMLEGNHVTTCALFRRELWERAGGFRDAGFGPDYVYEDWRLFQRMSALGARICNIVEEPLFRYRVHGDSQSAMHRSPAAMDAQRKAVRRFNADVIDEAAIEQSAHFAAERIEVDDALVNLVPRMDRDDRPTILLAMPFLLVGGGERLLSDIVAYLTARGYRVLVVTTLFTDPAFGDSTPWFAESTPEIYHLPRFLEPALWDAFVDYLMASRRPEVLWIVGSVYFYERLPELRRRHPELAVIDLLFNTVGHTASNRRFRDQIDLTLVENEEVEQWLLAAGEHPERVRRIESGVDLERYRPRASDQDLRAELGIPADAFVVGFSGRLSEEKAPDVFLDVAQRLASHSRLHFVMTGAGPLAAIVEARVRAADANPRLHFLGQIGDVRDAIAIYDVLLLPSRLDGRPVVVLESLAMGVPVIASRVGALPQLVEEGRTGFLCSPGDAAQLALRVTALAADAALHRSMRRAARCFAEAELDARTMLERYDEVLGASIGGRQPPLPVAQREEVPRPRPASAPPALPTGGDGVRPRA